MLIYVQPIVCVYVSPPEPGGQRAPRRREEGPLAQPYAAEPSAGGPLYAPHAHTVRYDSFL